MFQTAQLEKETVVKEQDEYGDWESFARGCMETGDHTSSSISNLVKPPYLGSSVGSVGGV